MANSADETLTELPKSCAFGVETTGAVAMLGAFLILVELKVATDHGAVWSQFPYLQLTCRQICR